MVRKHLFVELFGEKVKILIHGLSQIKKTFIQVKLMNNKYIK